MTSAYIYLFNIKLVQQYTVVLQLHSFCVVFCRLLTLISRCVQFSWSQLKSVMQDVDQELKELNNTSHPVNYRIHIGGKIYITLSTGHLSVDIREFDVPEGQDVPVPSTNGVALQLDEWRSLLKMIPVAEAANPLLA